MPSVKVPLRLIEELYECPCGTDAVAIRGSNPTTTYRYIVCSSCWKVHKDTDFDGIHG